jgi:hypothetical protein
MRILTAIVALCAALIVIKDARHWRAGDRRHASFRTVVVSVLILLGLSVVAHARPSPYPPVTQFNGDRYEAQAHLGPEVVRAVKAKQGAKARKRSPVSRRHLRHVPTPAPRPLAYEPYRVEAPLSLGEGVRREAIEALPARMLAGVVAPLAAKARQIVAACGSKVISGVRHTYVAGTGGRLSLHASGRAVDIKGNPACIMRHLHGWPGGASTDYAAVNHTHISYAPGGPEWGARFRHHRSSHRRRRT